MPTPTRHPNDWTEQQIALLRELAARNQSARAIAAEFPDKSRNAILGKAFRLGIRIDSRDQGRSDASFWKQDKNFERLKTLYFSPMGYSNQEIAAEIGCGLSMLRRGLAKMRGNGGGQARPKVKGAGNGRRPFIIRKRPRTAGARAKARAALRPIVPQISGEDLTGAIGILALNGHTCRWPVHGYGADMLYCGAEPLRLADRDLPYCGPHCRRAYVS